MKKRNCRKTDIEREQHDRAIRVRKMTDAQLCEYLDGLGVTWASPGRNRSPPRRRSSPPSLRPSPSAGMTASG